MRSLLILMALVLLPTTVISQESSCVGLDCSPYDGGLGAGANGGWAGGGDYGQGCCGFPKSIEADAEVLRASFADTPLKSLTDQQILGTLCENHPCNRLLEETASRILDRMIAGARYEGEQRAKSEAKWIGRLGAFFSALGLLIAWLAYRLSREADRRSIRNEVAIEHLQTTRKLQSTGETP